ncbi:MAG TPA: hypothetical protein VFX76_00430, partial [Roseiflexaceae bacterium]|nr:hypothetical protein [Roseiflexaceae bacterium]
MRMRVDHVAYPQTFSRRTTKVAVELVDFRIDQRRRTGIGTTDQVRQATAGDDALEDHESMRLRCLTHL